MTTGAAVVQRGSCWRATSDGLAYRDLNGNGALDPYEDPRLQVEERVDDLLARMTLEEKAALLFHQGLVVPDDGTVGEEPDMVAGISTRALVGELGPRTSTSTGARALRSSLDGTTGCRRLRSARGSASR